MSLHLAVAQPALGSAPDGGESGDSLEEEEEEESSPGTKDVAGPR